MILDSKSILKTRRGAPGTIGDYILLLVVSGLLLGGCRAPGCYRYAYGCKCEPDVSPNDVECREDLFDHAICCGNSGWPKEGACAC